VWKPVSDHSVEELDGFVACFEVAAYQEVVVYPACFAVSQVTVRWGLAESQIVELARFEHLWVAIVSAPVVHAAGPAAGPGPGPQVATDHVRLYGVKVTSVVAHQEELDELAVAFAKGAGRVDFALLPMRPVVKDWGVEERNLEVWMIVEMALD
jgi:hypothetical protein